MLVSIATEDSTVNGEYELSAVPHEGDEVSLLDASAVEVVYTVERVRFDVANSKVWLLVEPGESGGSKAKPPKVKKSHPWKK